MFLNINILKKLMKRAYKGGLAIAQTEERYYIAGGYWEMDIRKEFLPKQILAQIIELAGEIPDIGERFSATKEGNQMEVGKRLGVDTEGYVGTINITNFSVLSRFGTYRRILQDDHNNKIFIISNEFVDIADNHGVEEERGEYSVDVPYYHPEKGILWVNNVAAFHACWMHDDLNKTALENLEAVDLTNDTLD